MRGPENARAVVVVLAALGFSLSSEQGAEIERGKDLVQLRQGHSISTWSSLPMGSTLSRKRIAAG